MRWVSKTLAAVIILPAFFCPGFAQQVPDSSKAKRSIVVNVLDVHGNAVIDLAKENFRSRLNGKPVEVLDARYSIARRRIVILLDISGSMTGGAKWRIAREAVDDLLTAAPIDAPMAMLTFASNIHDSFDFFNGRSVIANWLSKGPGQQPHLKVAARTALFDAILAALKFLGPAQSGDTVYVITDGGDNASQATLVQTKEALLNSGVQLFAFLFDLPLPAPDDDPVTVTQEQEERVSFRNMVDDSGGSVFSIAGRRLNRASADYEYTYDEENRMKLNFYTKEFNVQVNGFWTLDIAEPSSSKESRMSVEIVDHKGKTRKDVRVTYSRMLSAAK
jgi:von Willebrand factor type A domain